MSEPLQKDQIVACWDREDCDKAIRIYIGKEGDLHRCRLPGVVHCHPDFELWEQCVPLEDLAPESFLGRETEQRERAEFWVSEATRRMIRIQWLCEQLQVIGDRNGTQECPPDGLGDCRIGSCAKCWKQASQKAVEA